MIVLRLITNCRKTNIHEQARTIAILERIHLFLKSFLKNAGHDNWEGSRRGQATRDGDCPLKQGRLGHPNFTVLIALWIPLNMAE